MKLLSIFLLGVFLSISTPIAQADEPTNPHTLIADWKQELRLVDDLMGIDLTQAQARAVDKVLATPERYSPVALYATARALFITGRKDEAARWFYSAQVRARFDATRCPDRSARQATTILTQRFGPPINRYAFQSPERLKTAVHAALAWDRATPHHYNHRWIDYHGIGSMDPDTPTPDTWDAVAERVRQQYLKSLEEALVKLEAGELAVAPPGPNDEFELYLGPETDEEAPSNEEPGCESCVYQNI